MEKVIENITLNVAGKNAFCVVFAKQFDNETREIQALITNNGKPILIGATDYVVVNYRRPKQSSDKTQGDYMRAYNGEVVDGDSGIVKVPIDFWALERSGEVYADVSIMNADSGIAKRLTTAAFVVTVYPASNYTRDGLGYSEGYDALLALFKEVNEYKKEITDTAQGAINHTLENEAQREAEFQSLKNNAETEAQKIADEAQSVIGSTRENEAQRESEFQSLKYDAEGAIKEISDTAQGVIDSAIERESEREAEYQTLKSNMEVVTNEAELSAERAAQSADDAAECVRSATSAIDTINATVGEFTALVATEKETFARQADNAATEIENLVSDFKLWYDELPEKGIEIGESYIDFYKLVTFKDIVNIDLTPTEPQHAVNKAYVDSHEPERAMNAYRLNDTFGSVILYDEKYGVRMQSNAGGDWSEGVYIVETTKEGNSFSTLTLGDADKKNLLSFACCSSSGARHVDIVKDGVYHKIEFPFADGTFALVSDLEQCLSRDGIVNGEGYVDFNKHVTFKSTVNIDVAPTENQHAANKGYVDGRVEEMATKSYVNEQIGDIAAFLDSINGEVI